jgi:Ca2+-binding EF-hand superfamily protein
MRKVFKAHDFNGNGKLDLAEFEEALAEFGYVFSFDSY